MNYPKFLFGIKRWKFCENTARCTLALIQNSLSKSFHSGIIYYHTCTNCKVTFYGKSFCHFYDGVTEHMVISNHAGQRLENVRWTGISGTVTTKLSIKFDDLALALN